MPLLTSIVIILPRHIETRVIFLRQVTPRKLYPWTALVLLTTLNFLNYIDRSVLFAVQPLVQSEFQLSNAQVGYLTSAFLLFYMVAAPLLVLSQTVTRAS